MQETTSKDTAKAPIKILIIDGCRSERTLTQAMIARALLDQGHSVKLLDEGGKPTLGTSAAVAAYMQPGAVFDRSRIEIDTRTEPASPASPTRPDCGQVGGDHYKRLGITPWDLIKAMEPTGITFVDYARADIIAYVARLKGAKEDRPAMLSKLREDLLKTAHYAKEAVAVIEGQLAHFEKDEEERRQGQQTFDFAKRPSFTPAHVGMMGERIAEGSLRSEFAQLDLPLVSGDF